jgi:hypothetical protein
MRKPRYTTQAEKAEHDLLTQDIYTLVGGDDPLATEEQLDAMGRLCAYIASSRRNSAEHMQALREVYQQRKDMGLELTHRDLQSEVKEKRIALEEECRHKASLPPPGEFPDSVCCFQEKVQQTVEQISDTS